MTIHYTCPHCNEKLEIPEQDVGQTGLNMPAANASPRLQNCLMMAGLVALCMVMGICGLFLILAVLVVF